MSAEEYIQELLEERDTLDPSRYGHAIRLINDEMLRVGNPQGGKGPPPRDYHPPEEHIVPQYKEEVVKLTEKIILPVAEFPKFNFVGRLLGPGGSIMKNIADTTRTKISILGKGSMKDKAKEEELSKSEDPKHEHFKEPLHVLVQVEAPKSEGHARIADALEVIKDSLLPQEDEMGGGGYPPEDGFRNHPGNHQRLDGAPPERGRGRGGSRGGPRGGSRGGSRGRGGGRDAPRDAPRDEYGYLPVSRFDDSGPSYEEPRNSYNRPGDKRPPPSNGYNNKKFRDDPYANTEPYHASRY